MDFYWVNVGLTVNEVLSGNFLWAPEASLTQSGKIKRLEHWDNVARVRAGDLIFCCHSQRITHLAKAKRVMHIKPRALLAAPFPNGEPPATALTSN